MNPEVMHSRPAEVDAGDAPNNGYGATGVYRRGGTFWIRYHGPRRDGTWGQICESARTTDPETARKLRDHRLHEIADHREGNHLFRGPYQHRTSIKS